MLLPETVACIATQGDNSSSAESVPATVDDMDLSDLEDFLDDPWLDCASAPNGHRRVGQGVLDDGLAAEFAADGNVSALSSEGTLGMPEFGVAQCQMQSPVSGTGPSIGQPRTDLSSQQPTRQQQQQQQQQASMVPAFDLEPIASDWQLVAPQVVSAPVSANDPVQIDLVPEGRQLTCSSVDSRQVAQYGKRAWHEASGAVEGAHDTALQDSVPGMHSQVH